MYWDQETDAQDVDAGVARFRFRYPDESDTWQWRKVDTLVVLSECLKKRLRENVMAPILRGEYCADGQRFAVFDFIIKVEKEVLPDWQSVERVPGADWGMHSLLTTTAVKRESFWPFSFSLNTRL